MPHCGRCLLRRGSDVELLAPLDAPQLLGFSRHLAASATERSPTLCPASLGSSGGKVARPAIPVKRRKSYRRVALRQPRPTANMLIEFGDAFDYAGPTSRAGAAKFKIMPLAGTRERRNQLPGRATDIGQCRIAAEVEFLCQVIEVPGGCRPSRSPRSSSFCCPRDSPPIDAAVPTMPRRVTTTKRRSPWPNRARRRVRVPA
jgi:hypothetical protein